MNLRNISYKRGILALLFAITFSMVILNIPTISIASTPTISMYIDPPVIWDTEMTPGMQFSVDIVVENVANLWAYQFWLSFNPDVLQGVSVENGPFLGRDTDPRKHPVQVVPGPGFDNEVGELKLFGAFIYFSGEPPHDRYLADGSGVLATVTFEVADYGCSHITLGTPASGLSNKEGDHLLKSTATGEWEHCYGEIWVPFPGGGGEWVPYEPWLNNLGNGFFNNLPGPELYIRKRGAHGASGVWPEWVVGDPEMQQTLYSRIMNYGFMGAEVEVEFVIRSELNGIKIMSDQVWIDPATWVGDEIVPAEVTIHVSFTPEIVGKYWVYGILYFKTACMTEKVPYYHAEDVLGGEGISRDIAVCFKIQ